MLSFYLLLASCKFFLHSDSKVILALESLLSLLLLRMTLIN